MTDHPDLSTLAREAAALADKATPPPWIADDTEGSDFIFHGDESMPVAEARGFGEGLDIDANMALIAHAGTHYGALARGYLALRDRLDEAERLVRALDPAQRGFVSAWCPLCIATGDYGEPTRHAPGCELAAFLAPLARQEGGRASG